MESLGAFAGKGRGFLEKSYRLSVGKERQQGNTWEGLDGER